MSERETSLWMKKLYATNLWGRGQKDDSWIVTSSNDDVHTSKDLMNTSISSFCNCFSIQLRYSVKELQKIVSLVDVTKFQSILCYFNFQKYRCKANSLKSSSNANTLRHMNRENCYVNKRCKLAYYHWYTILCIPVALRLLSGKHTISHRRHKQTQATYCISVFVFKSHRFAKLFSKTIRI